MRNINLVNKGCMHNFRIKGKFIDKYNKGGGRVTKGNVHFPWLRSYSVVYSGQNAKIQSPRTAISRRLIKH